MSERLGEEVSRETLAKLQVYVSELARWQRSINLIATDTLAHVWDRHVADCAQLATLASAPNWVDLGSGAGLPGLVIAALRPEAHLTLVESDRRKCTFLVHVAHAMELAVTVIPERIETVAARLTDVGVVTARAVGPLERLFAYSQPLLAKGATGLFPKGRGYKAELTKARESWTFDVDVMPSRTDPSARILRVTGLRRIGD